MKLFWMSKRGKFAVVWALLCIADTIFTLVNPNRRTLSGSLFVFMGGIVFSAILVLPELLYIFLPAKSVWQKWADLQASVPQKRRMLRAIIHELTPLQLNRKCRYATFVGNEGGQYLTTLNGCSCMDFVKRRVPCKHMYYLAMQLGLVDIPNDVIREVDRINANGRVPDNYEDGYYLEESDEEEFEDSESPIDDSARKYFESCQRTDQQILSIARENPDGILRKELVKQFPPEEKAHIGYRVDKLIEQEALRKEKHGTFVKLFVN